MVAMESPAPRVGKSDGPVVFRVHEDTGPEIVSVIDAVVIVLVLDRVNLAAHLLGAVDGFENRQRARHSTPRPEKEPRRRAGEGEGHHSAPADRPEKPGTAALYVGRQLDGLGRCEVPPL